MGSAFDTCLALSSFNAPSAIINALDLNKHIIYVRDEHGHPVARKLIGPNQDLELIGYRLYTKPDAPQGVNLAQHITTACAALAQRCGALLVGPDKHLNELRAKALSREGWACATSHDAKEATHYAKTFNPHAMIVELSASAQLDIRWLEAVAQLKMTPEPMRVALMPSPDWPKGQSLGYRCIEPSSSAQQIIDQLNAEQALTPRA